MWQLQCNGCKHNQDYFFLNFRNNFFEALLKQNSSAATSIVFGRPLVFFCTLCLSAWLKSVCLLCKCVAIQSMFYWKVLKNGHFRKEDNDNDNNNTQNDVRV